jgi:hypothetical protein
MPRLRRTMEVGEGGVVRVRALVGVVTAGLLLGLGPPAFARQRVATTTFRAPLARPMWCNAYGCASWDYYGAVALDAQVEPATTDATLPTGTVTFVADGSPIGTVDVGTVGQHNSSTGATNDVLAHLVATTVDVGSHQIAARYSGDSRYAASMSAPWTITVHANPTASSLTSSPNPSEIDEPPHIAVAVTPHWGGVATGMVSLYDSSTLVGTGPVDGSGVAWFQPPLAAGVHHLQAGYSPSGGFLSSSTPVVDQTVLRLTTAVTADPATLSTMTAHLGYSHPVDKAAPGGPVVGVTVDFSVSGVGVCSAITDAAGTASCSGPVAAAAEASGYTASFAGDGTYAPSSASASGI